MVEKYSWLFRVRDKVMQTENNYEKAGAIGLAHSCAALLAKEGIAENANAPALIETEITFPTWQRYSDPF
jgi:NAD(P)-dependent dehydrogenase (short-subunit alcohol dehydrogenase family)